MNRGLGTLVAALALLLSVTPASADWFEVRRTANIREAASSSSSLLGVAEAGEQFEIVDPGTRTRGYYSVDLGDGRIAYVHATRGHRHVEAPPAPAFIALNAGAPTQVMRVHYINVGQASAALLEFSCGAILIDAGVEEDGRSLRHLMGYLGRFFARRSDLNERLAALFVTHTHIDHNRALQAVAERYEIGGYIHNGQLHGSGVDPALWMENHTNAPGRPAMEHWPLSDAEVSATVGRGLSDDIIDPVACSGVNPRIRVLSAEIKTNPGWPQTEFADENNHSLVIRIDYGEASFLFTGDLEEPAIETMLHWYGELGMLETLDTDVYVAGHHGSHNGTTEDLMRAMSPEIAVISAGPHTRQEAWSAWQYGHPRRVTVEMLDGFIERQRPAVRTVRVGDGQRSFSAYRMRDAIYATAWDGDIVISARADGALRVSTSR